MTFKKAVEDTPNLKDSWCAGLQALRNVDKQRVDAEDTNRLKGSVNLDSTLKKKLPNDPIWDYGIGHQPTNRKEEIVYWVEIHPASAGEVKAVLAKLGWLKKWLREDAAQTLNLMRKEFIWVSSGKTTLHCRRLNRSNSPSLACNTRGAFSRSPTRRRPESRRSGSAR